MNKTFQGQTGGYRIEETADGSTTLWSQFFDQCCHSLDGAASETKYIYVEGCHVVARAKQKKSIRILEIGWGLGHGYKETIKALKEFAPDCKLEFYSMEIDPVLVEWSMRQDDFAVDISRPKIVVGDARKCIAQIPNDLDVIYQDAFSPQKNRTLWTVEWFSTLKAKCKPDAVLSTYSASSSIRKSLIAAGWIVEEMKGFGHKKSATRAFLSGKLDTKLAEHLARSEASPLYDR